MAEFGQKTLEKIEFIRSFDFSTLARREFGIFNLEECSEKLVRIAKLFSAVTNEELLKLPSQRKNIIATAVERVDSAILQCRQFNPETSNPKSERKALIDAVDVAYDLSIDAISPVIIVLEDMAELLISTRRNAADVQKLKEQTEQLKSETEEAARSSKAIATEVSVDTSKDHFEKAAEDFKTSSGRWLRSLLLASFGFFCLAFYLVYCPPPTTGSIPEINSISNKVLLLGSLVFIIFVSYKNYVSARHNWTVNFQRSNALKTYRALILELTPDEKAPIIAAAANCIYAHQSSGYSGLDVYPTPIGTVIEAVKSVAKDK
jgi:hypothetical protein